MAEIHSAAGRNRIWNCPQITDSDNELRILAKNSKRRFYDFISCAIYVLFAVQFLIAGLQGCKGNAALEATDGKG
jgi:hypothetical protein